MSVVIGIKDNDRVVLACDSQITSGGVKKIGIGANNYKIWHPIEKEKIIMGTIGSLREKNIIQTCSDIIRISDYLEEKINYKFVVRNIVPRIFKELKDSGAIDDSSKPLGMKNRYLLAYKNLLFQIGTDGEVLEIDNYTAIGSGANEALASLHNTTNESVEKRIIKAMKGSCINDIYVSSPIIIGDTKDNTFKIIKLEKE